ncbi:MAG TPA: Rieske 2Fe-2S domain-containing protein [Acidimicrobiales bacterium]|nr:Rieske 2Fe-2S domain-containing protein [Acidimicrobiales bacterium]
MSQSWINALEPLRRLPDAIAEQGSIDQVVKPLKQVADGLAPSGSKASTVLSGAPIGHPLHPLLTDVVIGCFTSAVAIDLVGGRKRAKAADRLIALGLLSAAPTVASGLHDWATLDPDDQRVGAVHAAGNAVANLLFGASWLSRKRGRRMRGRALALTGLAVAAAAGYLGGDLSFRRGAGVDNTAFLEGPEDWTAVADESALEEGKPIAVQAGDMKVLLVRQDGTVAALADRCAHKGGPLHEGEVADGCVTCPWHRSTFRLSDGSVVTGPTAHPQPTLQVRTVAGKIEVRR